MKALDCGGSANHGVHSGDTYTVAFDEPQRAVAPGQVAAFYDAQDPSECLGA